MMTEEAKEARRAYQRQYRKDNADRIRANKREWQHRNKERCNGYVRAWRRNHPDAVSEINARYWMKKAERLKREREDGTNE